MFILGLIFGLLLGGFIGIFGILLLQINKDTEDIDE